MITYNARTVDGKAEVLVFLDGKRVGTIHQVGGGYQYVPKGGTGMNAGDVLPTLGSVKHSIED
jgi:hypothetical protein